MAISALALLSFCGTAATDAEVVMADGAAAVAAESCSEVTYRWGGDVAVGGATPVYDTGLEVPGGDGISLTVAGISADGLDDAGVAHPLDVHVGGMRALPGAAIAGGRVAVSNASTTDLRVVGVSVVVRRCAVVASEASVPTSTPDSAPGSTATTTSGSDASAATVTMLPATGVDEWHQSVVGAVVIAVGAMMVSFGRRRHPAR